MIPRYSVRQHAHGRLSALTSKGARPLDSTLAKMLVPPAGLMAITDVLGSSPVDLNRLGAVARRHPGTADQLLRLCNSSLFSLAEPATNLENATILLGAEVLRTASLAWGIVETAGRSLPIAVVQSFWQHGLTAALLSEHIASRLHYPVMEAHLGGFLHDLGRLPLLMTVESEAGNAEALLKLPESCDTESERFGIDHCELGRRIGLAWSFPPAFVAVFSRHHERDAQAGDSELIRIVREAEILCTSSISSELLASGEDPSQDAQPFCSSQSGVTGSMSLMEVLELSFLQSAQHLKFRVPEPEMEPDLAFH